MLKVVCKIGKFTIRDAILFHKFCIFNKEYFVFLAHRMFGCKSFFGGVFVCFPTGLTCYHLNLFSSDKSIVLLFFFFHISIEKYTTHSDNDLVILTFEF